MFDTKKLKGDIAGSEKNDVHEIKIKFEDYIHDNIDQSLRERCFEEG